MKKFILNLLLLIGIRCHEKVEIVPIYDVHPILQVHLDSFIDEAAKRRIEIIIPTHFIMGFKDEIQEGDFPGLCTHYPNRNDYSEIFINTINKNWPDQSLEFIVFHELGHCILKRGHIKNNLSIMNETLAGPLPNYIMNNKRVEMVDELFK